MIWGVFGYSTVNRWAVQLSVCRFLHPCACVYFCWHTQPRRAGEALTLLSFSLPGPWEIPLFVYIELCRLAALPGSPACCCNIGAAGDLHSEQDLERNTQITPALWLLRLPVGMCVCGTLFFALHSRVLPIRSGCLDEFGLNRNIFSSNQILFIFFVWG